MPREGWISISIPEEMINEIKKMIEQNPHLGYTTISAYVTAALKRLFMEHSTLVPRFLSAKIQEEQIILLDNKIGQDVAVSFETGGVAHCKYCDAADCEHIHYALTLQEVQEFLKRKGWERKT